MVSSPSFGSYVKCKFALLGLAFALPTPDLNGFKQKTLKRILADSFFNRHDIIPLSGTLSVC